MIKTCVLSITMLIGLMVSGQAFSNEYASSKDLKKMFTTAYERQQLDNRRKTGVLDMDGTNVVSKVLNNASSVELRGIVYRKGKQPVVWVNESNTLKTQNIDSNIRVYGVDHRKSEDKVRLKVNDKLVKLKPGQVWSDFDDKAVDKYRTEVAE